MVQVGRLKLAIRQFIETKMGWSNVLVLAMPPEIKVVIIFTIYGWVLSDIVRVKEKWTDEQLDLPQQPCSTWLPQALCTSNSLTQPMFIIHQPYLYFQSAMSERGAAPMAGHVISFLCFFLCFSLICVLFFLLLPLSALLVRVHNWFMTTCIMCNLWSNWIL